METDKKSLRDEALAYHAEGRPGKIEVIPTKPYSTQKDLSLAYSPGVAEPCLEIEKNPDNAYKYTDKGNLVAVISNGTAVLGLGDIGARRPARHVDHFGRRAAQRARDHRQEDRKGESGRQRRGRSSRFVREALHRAGRRA